VGKIRRQLLLAVPYFKKKDKPMQDLINWLNAMPRDVTWHLEKQVAIRKWCLRDVPFKEGDRVKIIRKINTDGGWKGHEGMLAIGATGVVHKIDFNPYSRGGVGAWHADVAFDREWYTSGEGKSWWHGPVAETPAGMIPPSEYDQREYPQGNKHAFSLLVEDLAKAEKQEAACAYSNMCQVENGTTRRADKDMKAAEDFIWAVKKSEEAHP